MKRSPARQLRLPPTEGEVFSGWTVLSSECITKGKSKYVQCRCLCGKEKLIRVDKLLNGSTTKCNRWCRGEEGGPMAHEDYTGQQVGSLTYLHEGPLLESNHRTWVLRCECGNTCTAPLEAIRRGKYASCGHCLPESIFERRLKVLTRERTNFYRKIGVQRFPNIRPYDTWSDFKKVGNLCPEWEDDFPAFFQHWLKLTGTTIDEWFDRNVPWRHFETYRPDQDQPASVSNLSLSKYTTERAWHTDTHLYWKKLKDRRLLSEELEDSYLLFLNTFGVKTTGQLLKRKDLTQLHTKDNSEWITISRYSKKSDST